jgi:Flp pilus assembly pilin Flp
MRILRRFAICTRGQDLVEYILLLALMVIATTAMLVTAGESLSAVWNAPILGTANSASSTDLPGR